MGQYLILFLAGLLAASLSGIAGFGGALLLLPVLVHVLGIQAAVPVLTLAQLFGNGSRVWFNRHDLQWKSIGYFLLSAVPLSVAGSFLFAHASSKFVQAGIGLFLILIVGYRRFKKKPASLSHSHMVLGGALTGFLSGMAGSAGPLGAAFFLGLNLSPTAYLGSEAFTAAIMHLTKSVVYSRYALIGIKELLTGLVVGTGMIAGSYIGKKATEKIPYQMFVLIVEFLLVLSGLQLLWSAR